MAVITRRWARFKWPALALRHASPWRRKMSATSSFGRLMCGAAAGRHSNPLGSGARSDRRAADPARGDVAGRHGLCRRATGPAAGRGPDKIGIIPSAPARAPTAGPQILPAVTLPPATPKDSADEPRGPPQVAALTKLALSPRVNRSCRSRARARPTAVDRELQNSPKPGRQTWLTKPNLS